MRALIVDDSAVMRKVVERALHQAGIDFSEVLQAGNGEEALEALRQQPDVNLILTDINMPKMDGLQFLEQRCVEGLAPSVPVVIITTEALNRSYSRQSRLARRGTSASRSHRIR